MHALPNSKRVGLTDELRCRRVTDEDARGALVAAMLGAVNDDRTGQ
jgi:hypothetical protein